jgi:RimJ/RimL family protein N-acetyltransferase
MIKLQPFAKSDIPTLISWIDSPEFLLQWGGPGLSYPLDEAQLAGLIRSPAVKKPQLMAFKAVDGENQETVGHIELVAIDRGNESARIARVLVGLPHLRGRGIGTQMVQAILRIGFEQLGLHRIELGVFDFNKGAIACYKKAGFKMEGLLRDNRKMGNGYWSSCAMSILEHEWHAIQSTQEGPNA